MLNLPNQSKFNQSYFQPQYPEKCINCQNGKPIRSMSGYERRFYEFLDKNINVIEWGVEMVKIPYIFDLDNKLHTYYPDAYVKLKKTDGTIETSIVEIKPKKQLSKPNPPKNKNQKALKNYKYEATMYVKNQNKFKYARRYCEDRGYFFKILTEENLF